MDITYLGHSSFKLKGKSATLVTDPFDPKMVGIKFPKVKADIVTVSHDHEDHNRHDLIKDVKRVVNGPGEYEISEVSIIGVSTYHDDKKGKLRGKNTIYIIEMDKMRVVHLGDLGHKLKEKMVERLGNVDVLMVPTGGEYTIDSSQAIEVVQSIEPSYVIPMHYKVSGLDKKTFGKLEGPDAFLNEIGLASQEQEKLSVKRSDLGEDQKVVVLKRKS